MVVEREISSFISWLLQDGAFLQFALTFGSLALLATFVGFIVLLIRYGPIKAGEAIYNTISGGVGELVRTSPRRVSALASLAIKESIRRKVWVGLVVFALILAFADWFLATDHQDPVTLYLSVVLTAMTYLSLLLALLLSTFSLPNEFKSKTIYTIVTKPVRAGDIVLGRILGFTAIGTLLLTIMAALSYVFVTNALNHTHVISADALEEISGEDGEVAQLRGATGITQGHSHSVLTNAEGEGIAQPNHGHDHAVFTDEDQTSGALNVLRAQVPKRGEIGFVDRNGVPKDRGVSVGSEWTYRSFIEGGTQAAAVWTFSGINESVLRDDGDSQVLPIELIVRVFRTYKGDNTRPIQGSIQLRNPETGLTNSIETFGAIDAATDAANSFEFPRAQFDSDQKPIDLLDDLVSENGELEILVQSLERAQYYGFAQADCYIRLPDGNPAMNFVTGCLSIWVQMVIVIAIGVTASTFLNGPIAMMFTASFVLLGFFRDFIIGIATGIQPDGQKVYGGGPVEAFVRIVTQKNLITQFDDQLGVTIMKGVDSVLQRGMQAVSFVLPDFGTLNSVNYVSEGFAIPSAVIGRELAIAAAYIVGLSIAGYFFLRTREVAK